MSKLVGYEVMDENHDTIIRHECEIGELREQGDFILKRLDEQDANDVKIEDELLKKIGENSSKFSAAMWAVAMLLIGGLLSGFIYVLILK
jgi:hypothetical protein